MIVSLVSLFCLIKLVPDNAEMYVMLITSSKANAVSVNNSTLEALEMAQYVVSGLLWVKPQVSFPT